MSGPQDKEVSKDAEFILSVFTHERPRMLGPFIAACLEACIKVCMCNRMTRQEAIEHTQRIMSHRYGNANERKN